MGPPVLAAARAKAWFSPSTLIAVVLERCIVLPVIPTMELIHMQVWSHLRTSCTGQRMLAALLLTAPFSRSTPMGRLLLICTLSLAAMEPIPEAHCFYQATCCMARPVPAAAPVMA